MIDKLTHIKIKEIEYPIAFTMNVMESVQEKYGSMKKWTEALQPEKGAEPKIKDVIWTFMEFINEGVEIENEEKGEDRKLLTHRQVGRLVTNMKEITDAITNLTIKSVKTEENPNE